MQFKYVYTYCGKEVYNNMCRYVRSILQYTVHLYYIQYVQFANPPLNTMYPDHSTTIMHV